MRGRLRLCCVLCGVCCCRRRLWRVRSNVADARFPPPAFCLPPPAKSAGSFCYCVSLTGVTGARGDVPTDLKDFVDRIRAVTDKNLAVGFGISTPAHVAKVAALADGVVVGSAILNAIDAAGGQDATPAERAAKVQAFIAELKAGAKKTGDGAPAAGADAKSNVRACVRVGGGSVCACGGGWETLISSPSDEQPPSMTMTTTQGAAAEEEADVRGRHFGQFGGRYIPETLVEAHKQLEEVRGVGQSWDGWTRW